MIKREEILFEQERELYEQCQYFLEMNGLDEETSMWYQAEQVRIAEEKYAEENICCMCGKGTRELFKRVNGDEYCKECNEKYCQHLHTERIPVANGLEVITICHDCGYEV